MHDPKNQPVPGHGASAERTGARWALPLLKFDEGWTRFETWLAFVVVALEISALCLWIVLKGFATPSTDGGSGATFRSAVGAVILGMAAFYALRAQPLKVRRWSAFGGVVVGLATGKLWATVGVGYASNLLNWYQQACFLTLLGGLRGVATRLTLLLALVGGSLATARGKHVVIDIVTRFVGHRPRLAMTCVAWVASAVVTAGASWGFFDHISIENFGARSGDTAGQKVSAVIEHLGEDFFISRKQLGLDLKATPHILLKGEEYSEWLTGTEWNQWVDDSGMVERYGLQATNALKIPPDDKRTPLIAIPGRGEPRGELINAANLVFPIGLLVISLRFILRMVLVLTGHAELESDEFEDLAAKADLPQKAPG